MSTLRSRILLVSSLLWLGLLWRSFSQRESNFCRMTYMYDYPQYSEIFRDPDTHYRLTMYSEGDSPVEEVPSCNAIPVLFIPGSSGSYAQVRSAASIARVKTARLKQMQRSPSFTFFSIDFNDENTGLFGGYLNRQFVFANRSVVVISQHYRRRCKSAPTEIAVIGHSMGGLIARMLMTQKRDVKISLIFTLATPHLQSVVPFDIELFRFYSSLRRLSMDRSAVTISVGGGPADIIVPSHLTSGHIFPQELGIDVVTLSDAVRDVWASADHRCIVWCNGLMRVVNRILFDTYQDTSDEMESAGEIARYHLTTPGGPTNYHRHASPPDRHAIREFNVEKLTLSTTRELSYYLVRTPAAADTKSQDTVLYDLILDGEKAAQRGANKRTVFVWSNQLTDVCVYLQSEGTGNPANTVFAQFFSTSYHYDTQSCVTDLDRSLHKVYLPVFYHHKQVRHTFVALSPQENVQNDFLQLPSNLLSLMFWSITFELPQGFLFHTYRINRMSSVFHTLTVDLIASECDRKFDVMNGFSVASLDVPGHGDMSRQRRFRVPYNATDSILLYVPHRELALLKDKPTPRLRLVLRPGCKWRVVIRFSHLDAIRQTFQRGISKVLWYPTIVAGINAMHVTTSFKAFLTMLFFGVGCFKASISEDGLMLMSKALVEVLLLCTALSVYLAVFFVTGLLVSFFSIIRYRLLNFSPTIRRITASIAVIGICSASAFFWTTYPLLIAFLTVCFSDPEAVKTHVKSSLLMIALLLGATPFSAISGFTNGSSGIPNDPCMPAVCIVAAALALSQMTPFLRRIHGSRQDKPKPGWMKIQLLQQTVGRAAGNLRT